MEWDIVSLDQNGVFFPQRSEVAIMRVDVPEIKAILGTDRLANVSLHLLELPIKESMGSDLVEVVIGDGVRRSRYASVK